MYTTNNYGFQEGKCIIFEYQFCEDAMQKPLRFVVIFIIATAFLCSFEKTIFAGASMNQPSMVPGGQGPFGIPGGPQFQTYEEFMQWQEVETQKINQFVETLSKEEQAQFFKDVAELEKVMSEMDPSDLEQFVKSMQEPAYVPEALPVPAPQLPPTPIAEETTKKAQEPEVSLGTADTLSKIIEDIVMRSERFLRTSKMIPELPGNIEKWISKNQLKEWKADVTWEQLSGKINELNHKLHLLNDADPKTKKPKYLAYLSQQETIKNNLSHLKDTLNKYEPKIEAPSFGLGKVTKESRQAIKEVLSAFAEAIYKLDMIADITKVIDLYEPRAKELRESEEQAQKRALEESKKPRYPSARVDVGGGGDYGGGGGYGGGYGSDYYPGSYGNTGYDYQNYSPDQGYHGSQGYPYSEGAPYEMPGQQKPGGEMPKGEGAEGKTPPGGAGKPEAGAEAKEDPATKRALNKIEKSLDEFASAAENAKLRTIQTHLTDNSPVDADVAACTLPTAVRKLKINVVDPIKALKVALKKLNPASEKNALEELRVIAAAHKELIDTINSQLNAIKASAISDEKSKAYKTTLDELAAAIKSFNNEIGSYGGAAGGQTRAPAPYVPAQAAPSARPPMGAEEAAPVAAAPAAMPAGADRVMARIYSRLEKANDALSDDPQLSTIDTHIQDAASPASLSVVQSVKETVTNLKGAQKEIDTLTKLLAASSAEQKKAIKDLLQSELDSYASFKDFTKQEAAIRALPAATLRPDKRYAYLKEDITPAMLAGFTPAEQKAVEEAKKAIPAPVKLKDLADAIQAVKKAINNLG